MGTHHHRTRYCHAFNANLVHASNYMRIDKYLHRIGYQNDKFKRNGVLGCIYSPEGREMAAPVGLKAMLD